MTRPASHRHSSDCDGARAWAGERRAATRRRRCSRRVRVASRVQRRARRDHRRCGAGGAPRGDCRRRTRRSHRRHRRDAGGPADDIGRTRALTLRPEGASYTLRYQVQLPQARSGRCPLWIPTVAAGVTAASVRVTTRLPKGARAAGTMPTFRWNGDEGTATIPDTCPRSCGYRMRCPANRRRGTSPRSWTRPRLSLLSARRWCGRATGAGARRGLERVVPESPGFGWTFYGFFVAGGRLAGGCTSLGGAGRRARPDESAMRCDPRTPHLPSYGDLLRDRRRRVDLVFPRRPRKTSSSPPDASIGPWVGGAVLAATQISAGTFVGTLGGTTSPA